MKVEICVGSSCHVRGSYEVVKKVEAYLIDNTMEKDVELRGCFCMGHCTEGVSMKIEEEMFQVSEASVTDLLEAKLMEKKNAAD